MPAAVPSSCNCYPSAWLLSGGCKRSWAKTHSLARALFAQSCFSSPGCTHLVPGVRTSVPRILALPYTLHHVDISPSLSRSIYPTAPRLILYPRSILSRHVSYARTLSTSSSLWPVPGPPVPRHGPLPFVTSTYIPIVSYIPLHLICALFTYAVHMLSHFTTYYHLRTLASWTLPYHPVACGFSMSWIWIQAS